MLYSSLRRIGKAETGLYVCAALWQSLHFACRQRVSTKSDISSLPSWLCMCTQMLNNENYHACIELFLSCNQSLYYSPFKAGLYWICPVRYCYSLQILVLLNIFRTNRQNLTKFYKYVNIDETYVGIVTCHFFGQICNPLIVVRIWFLLNILRKNSRNKTKLCIHIIIDKIYDGIVKHHFSEICNGVMALDWRQNLVFAQYLVNQSRTNGPINAHLTIAQVMPRYNHNNEPEDQWSCKRSPDILAYISKAQNI